MITIQYIHIQLLILKQLLKVYHQILKEVEIYFKTHTLQQQQKFLVHQFIP
jgi:hypothetical protein